MCIFNKIIFVDIINKYNQINYFVSKKITQFLISINKKYKKVIIIRKREYLT